MRNNSSKGTQKIYKKEVKGMNKIMMGALMALVLVGTAFAVYNENTPYTITLEWIIPSDTTFSVEVAGEADSVDFTPASKNENMTEPDGQNAGTSTAMLVVTNQGNAALDLYHNASSPAYADVRAGVTNDYYASTDLGAAMVQFSNELALAGTVDIYFWSNITDGTSGTSVHNYQMNATVD